MSQANLVLKLSYLMASLHNLLLNTRLFLLQFNDLFLHVVVVSPLKVYLFLQVIKVLHNLGVNQLDVLIVECAHVVVHQTDLLP